MKVPMLLLFSLVTSLVFGSSAVSLSERRYSTSRYRGKYLDSMISAERLYVAYKEVQREYLEQNESKYWKIMKSKDGVEIAVLQSKEDPNCPFIRMRAMMPASPKALWRFMGFRNWGTFMRLVNPFYEGMTVLQEFCYGEATLTIIRKRSTRILGFGRRDFGLVSVLDLPQSDGVWMSGTFTIISPGTLPQQPGFIRAFQDILCIFKPLPDGLSEMTIILRTDLNDSSEGGSGGFVPMWAVVKTIGSAGHRAIRGLQNHVRELPRED